jgi:hypothetical protein
MEGKMGWLAAFGTSGYPDGNQHANMLTPEPPLLEELGVNFGHIKSKVFLGWTLLILDVDGVESVEKC